MDINVLYSMIFIDKVLLRKRQVRIRFLLDSIEISCSKYVFGLKAIDENIPYVETHLGKYEDIITYTFNPSSITFWGEFVNIKNGKKKISDSARIDLSSKHIKEFLKQIKETTPILTLKEKKKICPPEKFGKIVIEGNRILQEFDVWIDKQHEGKSQKRQITVFEPYGKHFLQVELPMFDSSGEGSLPPTVFSHTFIVELTEEKPEVHLMIKRYGNDCPELGYVEK